MEILELAIEMQPDNGLALDAAAHCAFVTGDGTKGRALAKRARQLKHTETYRKWREGGYRKKKRNKPKC